MSKTAFIFPGQGSQYAGMGKELAAEYSACSSAFEEADSALGFSLRALCFEGPEETLRLTENTQPAILVTSVAIWRILEQAGVQPAYVAGHSLGEYSALVAAGALSLTEAVLLVRKRGRYMQEAVPVGRGAMAALIGIPPDGIDAICREASQGRVVSPANINSPSQIVIAGEVQAVQRAAEIAKERGAKAINLPVSAPFHCALMKTAQERLSADLQGVTFSRLKIPLITNVDAEIIHEGVAASDALLRQVTAPVRWSDSIEQLIRQGVSTFVEVGPGRVLSGLIRKINSTVKTFNVEDKKSLNAFLAHAKNGAND